MGSRKKNGRNLYLIGDGNGRVKIGSANNTNKRLRELQTGNPDRLKIIAEFEDVGYQEPFIQKLKRESRIRRDGEWFSFTENSLGQLIKFLIKRSNGRSCKIDKSYND